MADREKARIAVDEKLGEDLDALAAFLNPHPAAHPSTKSAEKPALWAWRKTLAFLLVSSLIGWSAMLGLVYLLYSLF